MQPVPQFEEESPLPPRKTQHGWLAASLGTLVGGVISIIAGLVVGAGAVFAVLASRGSLEDIDFANMEGLIASLATDMWVVGPSVIAQHGVMLMTPFVVLMIASIPAKKSLGLSKGAHPGIFVLASLGIVALGPTSDWLARSLLDVFPDASFGNLEAIEDLVKNTSPLLLWPFVALIPGFSEEFLFRGLLQRGFGRGIAAICISAVCFAVFHMDPPHVVGVLPLGFYLAWLAARTDTIWVGVVAHIVNNSVAIIAVAFADQSSVESDEALPFAFVALGWLIGAACIAGIWHLSKNAPEEAAPVPVLTQTEPENEPEIF